MRLLSFTGRVLFSAIFLASGVQKLGSFNLATGGPTMDMMAPRMDAFIRTLENALKTNIPVTQAHYPLLLAAAIALELGGSVLFLLNKSLGALMLLGFMIPVTAIMHTSWLALPSDSPEGMQDMINFYKNLAMIGALLLFLDMKRP